MKKIFERCLNAQYIHTPNGGDYAIEVDGETLYILFECSDGAEDWRNNFKFPAKPYKNMSVVWRCHGGFLGVWKAMQDRIEIEVQKILNAQFIKEIVCVGYSHGAALAVLATEDMEYLHGDNCRIYGYGFGAPRVLWGIVPKEVNQRLKNFTTIRNVPDIVTHVPPKIFGFHNAGKMVKIGAINRKYGVFMSHHPNNYIQELERLEKETEDGT